jgi:hypothetical protein
MRMTRDMESAKNASWAICGRKRGDWFFPPNGQSISSPVWNADPQAGSFFGAAGLSGLLRESGGDGGHRAILTATRPFVYVAKGHVRRSSGGHRVGLALARFRYSVPLSISDG